MTRDAVARYYDRNTTRFLRFGGSGGSYAIHRPLWAPGVASTRDAAAYINTWLARELSSRLGGAPGSVVDLGCGVGGTLFHLGAAFPRAGLLGVTISSRQISMARSLGRELGMEARSTFLLDDFQTLRGDGRADAVVAIESFAHSSSPDHFLAAAATYLRPGGVLVIVDDFLTRPHGVLSRSERRRVEQFLAGWHLGNLGTVDDLGERCRAFGLEHLATTDFTSFIRLDRPRDRAIALLAPAFRAAGLVRLPFFANMIGGNGLRSGLKMGVLRYAAIVLGLGSGGVGNPRPIREFRGDRDVASGTVPESARAGEEGPTTPLAS